MAGKMPQQYESREHRVQQIAQAALELIAEEGLRRFTTRAIAEKVGITDGTIFRHFKNKQEIVLAAMDLLEDAMFADAFPKDEQPLLRLEKFFRKRAALLGEQGSIGRLMFSEHLPQAAGVAGLQKLKSWRMRNMAFVNQCLEEVLGTPSLSASLEPHDVGVIVQGALLTFAFHRAVGDDSGVRDDLEQRIDRTWRTLCRLIER